MSTQYFLLRPEVAGGWGERTEADTSVHPPVVRHLEYRFEGWLGDPLLESFPCFIITAEAARSLREAGATGFSTDDVMVSTSELFEETNPNTRLPKFLRLLITGKENRDDIWMTHDHRLAVSDLVLGILKKHGMSHSEITTSG